MLTYATLFSGVGGWDQGLEAAGFGKPLWMCEIGAFQRKVLAHRYPGVRVYEDVTRLHAAGYCVHSPERRDTDRLVRRGVADASSRTDRGCPDCITERPDILVASPPCQDLSVAGLRAGLAGARSGLFFDFVRLAGELRPSWILMEQVPGLLSSNGGRDFEVVIDALVECGYGLSWRTLNARYFGVPQRRRRVFLVGRFGGPCPAEILFESEGSGWDPAPRDEAGADIAHALRSSTRGVGNPDGDDFIPEVGYALRADPGGTGQGHNVTYIPEVGRALTGTMGKHHDDDTDTMVAHTLRGSGFDASEDGTGRGTPIIAAPLTAGGHPNSHSPGRRKEDDENLVAIQDVRGLRDKKQNGIGITDDAQEMYSLTKVDRHGIGQGASVRRLTPTECERLLGWPDGWTCLETWTADRPYSTAACTCSDGPRYAACGNGVVSDCAEWVGRNLLAVATFA